MKPEKFSFYKNASLGKKIALLCAISVLIVFLAGSVITSAYLGDSLNKESLADLILKTKIMLAMMDAVDGTARNSIEKMASGFMSEVPGPTTVSAVDTVKIGSTDTPEMRINGKIVNLSTGEVDRFTNITGAVATIFARKGDDFFRITTSLKKEDGSRAVGTTLDKSHPAYPLLLKGEPYLGEAKIFGKYYMTKYIPIKDASGNVIGSYFVGSDLTEQVKKMSDAIKPLKIGKTGYFFMM